MKLNAHRIAHHEPLPACGMGHDHGTCGLAVYVDFRLDPQVVLCLGVPALFVGLMWLFATNLHFVGIAL